MSNAPSPPCAVGNAGPEGQTLARLEGISKRFGAVLAVDDASFDLQRGEVHALLGENGAGKTTLMNILYGLYHADAGAILVAGQQVRLRSPADAQAQGIGMVHQSFRQIPTLTVAENILLGLGTGRPLLDLRAASARITELSSRYGLEVEPDRPAWQLSAGQRQRVEIVKVLFREARILILDEPTSVLTPLEAEGLFRFVAQFKREGGGVVFISHKLGEVLQISDRISVMRDGKLMCTVPREGTNQNDLACLMVGREVVFRLTKTAHEPGEPLLSTDRLCALTDSGLPALSDVSLAVHRGEILGVAGVAGNGQGELAEVIAGLRRATSGDVRYKGASICNRTADEIKRRGVAMSPDNPRLTGVFPKWSVRDNAAMRLLNRSGFRRAGLVNEDACTVWTGEVMQKYDVRPRDPLHQAGQLSGGNLQKLVIGSQLALLPDLVVVTDPTAGLDVGATEFIRKQLLAERDAGKGVLLISSDLEEILSLADRIAVLYQGRVAGVIRPEQASSRSLGLLMAGLQPDGQHDDSAALVAQDSGSQAVIEAGQLPSVTAAAGEETVHEAEKTEATTLGRGRSALQLLSDRSGWISLATSLLAIAFAAAAVAGLVALFGVEPARMFRAMWLSALGTPNGLAETLVRMCPLLLAGLGIVVAFRSGVWNIGAEGQIYMGGLGATLVAMAGAGLPKPVLLPLVALGGLVGGGLYGLLPGVLRAYRGVNELITTIMLNYVAILFVGFLVSGPMKDTSFVRPMPQSPPLVDAARFARLIPATRSHLGIFLALAMAVVVFVFLWKSVPGWRMRAVGENATAARFAGVNVRRQIALALGLSGALAGLAGMVEVAGTRGALTADFSANFGFTAIAVALFGGLHPVGVVVGSAFFAFLAAGAEGLQRSVGVHSATVYIIQGLVLVFVLARRVLQREP